jgi:GT2 family glycosyltransferase
MYRTAWDILGGFDKRFTPHDYEDVDLGMRIGKSNDFSLILRDDLPLRHNPASTIGYTDERFEHTVKMRALFAEKWGLSNEPERP